MLTAGDQATREDVVRPVGEDAGAVLASLSYPGPLDPAQGQADPRSAITTAASLHRHCC